MMIVLDKKLQTQTKKKNGTKMTTFMFELKVNKMCLKFRLTILN